MGAMQAAVIALLRPACLNLEVGEHRSGLGEHGADLLLEYLKFGKLVDPPAR